jgi:serralysin
MNAFSRALALAACLLVSTAPRPCRASFHLWNFKEVFSNQDGTVQFVELFTTAGTERFLNNHVITATSDGNAVSFTLDHDVAGSTANKHLLLATAGFAALAGGVVPDYLPLPANFFNPNAASITIDFPDADSITFAGSTLPKNGINSLTDQSPAGVQNLVSGVNSPTNFAGAVGSINVSTPVESGDFNSDGAVNGLDLAIWKSGFGATGAAALKSAGNADGDSDVDGRDFLIWQRGGSPSASVSVASVPEPASIALLGVATFVAAVRLRVACSRP